MIRLVSQTELIKERYSLWCVYPLQSKKKVIQEKGIWQLASDYEVVFTDEEIECILKRYYTEEAQKDEKEAQNAKKNIVEIMGVLRVQTSVTFDQLEKDCIARICENLVEADEATCNLMRDSVIQYDALEKNKKEYLDLIQKQIETIWTKEDGEIFDNIYLNTDIYNQNEINNSIEFIKQRGRTPNAERYVAALQACCNVQNINNARIFQKKGTKNRNILGIILLLAGIVCLFIAPPLVLITVPGLILMIKYDKLKKNWNILTLDGTKVHNAIKLDNPTDVSNDNNNRQALPDGVDEAEVNKKNNNDKITKAEKGKQSLFITIKKIIKVLLWIMIGIVLVSGLGVKSGMGNAKDGILELALYYITALLILIIPTLVLMNFMGIRNRLPLFKKKKFLVSVIAFLMLSIFLSAIDVVAITIIENMFSIEYQIENEKMQ